MATCCLTPVSLQHTKDVLAGDAPPFFGQRKSLVALANVSLRHQGIQRCLVVRALVRVEGSVVIIQQSPKDARLPLIEDNGRLYDALNDFRNRGILLSPFLDDLLNLAGIEADFDVTRAFDFTDAPEESRELPPKGDSGARTRAPSLAAAGRSASSSCCAPGSTTAAKPLKGKYEHPVAVAANPATTLPMSAPPPSPQKAMTLMGSSLILPLRMSALRPAAVPRPAEPLDPSCVCIQGTTPRLGAGRLKSDVRYRFSIWPRQPALTASR